MFTLARNKGIYDHLGKKQMYPSGDCLIHIMLEVLPMLMPKSFWINLLLFGAMNNVPRTLA
jgi:hypothetical protein